MLHTAADTVQNHSPSTPLDAYFEQLVSVIKTASPKQLADKAGLTVDKIDALGAGEQPTLTVEQAAAILAVDDASPDAEAIVFELRDHLLMGMTTAVLDVDTIAATADTDLTGQEVQQAIEGRAEMTLSQLAAIQSVIDGREN